MIDYGFGKGVTHVIGIDEAGWGAIAGPLSVGGCIVRVDDDLEWLDVKDSKKYSTERLREIAYINIRRWEDAGKLEFFSWAADADEVSKDPAKALLNAQICVASILRGGLDANGPLASSKFVGILVDGNKPVRYSGVPSIAVPKADDLFKVVSAASVVAKVERDRELTAIGEHYKVFDFHKNKGYPTAQHLELLKEHGPCAAHRTNIHKVQQAQRMFDAR